jgi:hypothetical protein
MSKYWKSCLAKDPRKITIEKSIKLPIEHVENEPSGKVIVPNVEVHSPNLEEIEVIDTEEVTLEESVASGPPDTNQNGF